MTSRIDPRAYQIAVLSALIAYGVTHLDLEILPRTALAAIGAALAAQALGALITRAPFDPRSALISGLSLALLLRTHEPALAAAAGAIAVGSKHLIRFRGKHLFNPSCIAIVALLAAASDHAWVSAGQWGSGALFAFAASGLGLLVLNRSRQSDVTWAFLAAYAAIALGRAAWLGDPWQIPLHGLSSGSFLVFSFFMISDPKTLPDARAGRIAYAVLVATSASLLGFGLYWTNPLLWALAFCAPCVPLIDSLVPGERYGWTGSNRPSIQPLIQEKPMRATLLGALAALGLLLPAGPANAFCGFYVAKADTGLFNKSSQVVLVRDGDRTVITMSNDFRGDPAEFAMVIPVPTFIEREQIHVGDRAVIEHLDAYTAPRLVEYFDPDPCRVAVLERSMADARTAKARFAGGGRGGSALGVRIEAAYSVGEYDILILSAEQSDGLARWLRSNGYRLPRGAERVLDSYLKQDMRFFVAKVNLKERQKLGYGYLRPLQVAYESPKFMLPIRLGTLNADGTQELFVYALTRRGRVETTNYRTVKLPTGGEVPTFVKAEFADFYRALFDEQVRRENMRSVFLEYAWDMNWCDPCAADPLSDEELRGLGVFWLGPQMRRGGAARNVFVTRLHLRYDADHFPSDLIFQQTADRQNFQGRYVVRHPFSGPATCPAAQQYRAQLRERQEREARTLASLTGWDMPQILARLVLPPLPEPTRPWWQVIWED